MGRGVSFSSAEDVAIVKAWLAVAQDPIVGTDQTLAAFWERIFLIASEKQKSLKTRTSRGESLRGRYGAIQKAVGKFVGVHKAVFDLNESGKTDLDRFTDACQLYKEEEGAAFQFKECWDVLKESPKWMEGERTLNAKPAGSGSSRPSKGKSKDLGPTRDGSSPAVEDYPGANERADESGESSNLHSDNNSETEGKAKDRPIGTKLAKRQRSASITAEKQKSAKLEVMTGMADELRKSREDTKTFYDSIVDIETKRVQLEGDRVKTESEKHELEILQLDTSKLDPVAATIVKAKRQQLLAKYVVGSGNSVQ